MTDELRECPGCGDAAPVSLMSEHDDPGGILCSECGFRAPHPTAWNNRKPGPATEMVLRFAKAVVDTNSWSQATRDMFKDFLCEHGRPC